MTTADDSVKAIHKDMTIEAILGASAEKAPQVIEVMTEAGLHCVGCGAATFETLEQGIMGHGMPAEYMYELIDKINAVLEGGSAGSDGPFTMSMTERAVQQVYKMMTMENKVGQLFRISVIPGGCSGFSYDLKFVETSEPDDIEMEFHGLLVFIDPNSTEMLQDIEIDYVESLNESGFKYRNPNANSSCGCGMSFN